MILSRKPIAFCVVAVGCWLSFARADEAAHNQWLFSSPARPTLPKVDRDWPSNSIDQFIAESHARLNITPSGPATRWALLRRATFDVTGLPPTIDEQREFVNDRSERAFDRVVDRLLASPRFGERWARVWLDLVRFAESDGFKSDNHRPDAFRYRDYVIKAFNADLGYDDFVRQQLAGDETEPTNPEAIIATGLNRLYPDEDNAANLFQRRQEILDDITDVTSLAFMGLTMGCAQCHDHKFDQILQEDYFRLQAFFAPLVERNDYRLASAEQIAEYERRLGAWRTATESIRTELDDLFAELKQKDFDYKMGKFAPDIQACVRTPPADRGPLEEQIARMALKQAAGGFDRDKAAEKLPPDRQARYEKLKAELAAHDSMKPHPLPTVMSVSDIGDTAPPTHLLIGGNWKNPDAEVEPGIPLQFQEAESNATDTRLAAVHVAAEGTTGRRSQLAAWLTSSHHPLTARVIVNRVWQHYFGDGIVATPNDFGVQGSPPTHAKLLDWLAVELVEHDWNLKHIHRLILTSATYQQSSHARDDEAARRDPENRLLWRAQRRRLSAESIRDNMLAAAGILNNAMFGPGIRPELPDGVSDRYAWRPDEDVANRYRRSVYVLAKRNMRYPLFDDFDLPDMFQSCGKRAETTTATQALTLLNGGEAREVAARWADRLLHQWGDDVRQIAAMAYQTAWGRPADEREIEMAYRFLSESHQAASQSAANQADPRGATTDFCHALFNTNEFIYID
jgi:hypothetical protein